MGIVFRKSLLLLEWVDCLTSHRSCIPTWSCAFQDQNKVVLGSRSCLTTPNPKVPVVDAKSQNVLGHDSNPDDGCCDNPDNSSNSSNNHNNNSSIEGLQSPTTKKRKQKNHRPNHETVHASLPVVAADSRSTAVNAASCEGKRPDAMYGLQGRKRRSISGTQPRCRWDTVRHLRGPSGDRRNLFPIVRLLCRQHPKDWDLVWLSNSRGRMSALSGWVQSRQCNARVDQLPRK